MEEEEGREEEGGGRKRGTGLMRGSNEREIKREERKEMSVVDLYKEKTQTLEL